jgi:hypothetical protein
LTAKQGSREFALVLFKDGGYGITRDADVLDGYVWTDASLDACIETFMMLAGIEFDTPQVDSSENSFDRRH